MSVEKRGDKYLARIYKGKSKTFDTKKEAKFYETQIKNFKNNNPGSVVSGKALFSEVATKYLRHVERSKEFNTYKSYESKYRIWIRPHFEHLRMENINALTITSLQDANKDAGIGDSAFDIVNIVLFEIFQFACRQHERYIMENPMVKVKRREAVKRPLSHADYWSMEEAEKVLKEARSTPYYDSIVFILNTGLRFNEFACIQKDTFDMTAGVLTVHQQICERKKDGANFYVKTTKGKEHRSISLNPIAKRLATELISTSKDLFLFCPGDTQEKLIMLKKGNKAVIESHKIVTNRTFAYVLQRICKSAQVKYIGPHGLRHTFSANFLMNGGNIFTLSKLLGHKSINTTIDNYGHLSHEFMAASANIVSFGES